MNNNIKKAMEDIPIPAMLHERGLMGIHQAKEEWDTALTVPLRSKRIMHRIVVASIVGVLSISATVMGPNISAAIQKALQFVPGLGIVQKLDHSKDSYMLTEPIDIKFSNQTGIVTAMLVQKKSATIEMDVTKKNITPIKIINEAGKVYESSHISTYGGDDFSTSHVIYDFNGPVDIKDHAKLFFTDSPQEVVTIPLSKVSSMESLDAIGETKKIQNLAITAIPTPSGHKGRIFLNTEDSNAFRYDESFAEKGDLILNDNLSITDELGHDYSIENKGISWPFKDFYFYLGSSEVKQYTLTIPQLMSVGHEEVNVSINIPDGTEGLLNQSFNIAGFSVNLTHFKKIKSPQNEDLIEISVEMPSTQQQNRSLKNFDVSNATRLEQGRSTDDTTGVLTSFTLHYNSNVLKKLDVTVSRPIIDIKGPWIFNLAADKFKSKQFTEHK
ncbi:hypothetical protein J2Z69_003362 [Paenibacillus shirakamiensis]|uniref:DUF4179 domain-containing protein n=1 Tax=Paenibacillus shirakamiensis TaxID=1265935 RepID=A0ABS4JKP8_9BACL|nr:hypothetical protein [Paenibacillus shirakamiensis]MBP2002290.1 hypothetical protein [Paenibacillus shirakamiensis]